MTGSDLPLPPHDPLASHIEVARGLSRRGAAIVVFALFPILGWMALAPLSSAVVAQAHVKVDLNRQPVQHSEGGLVREVHVRDGQKVKKGDPLLVLGDVSVDADRNRLDYRVLAERVSLARLEAERDMARAISFPIQLLRAAEPDTRVLEQMAKERSLFNARREALTGN